MNTKFNLIVFLLALTLVNCKEERTFDDFKFIDKEINIDCEKEELQSLINEAIYSFEDDITKFYAKEQPTMSIVYPYSQFIRNAISGRVKYAEVATPHTVKIFEALKKENSLWDTENTESHLNYKSSFFNCISDKIQDQNLKTTLKALISTNSMSPKLFGSPLMSRYQRVASDKYLAAYIAFDLYYANFFDVDLSNVKERPEPKVDFNQIPK